MTPTTNYLGKEQMRNLLFLRFSNMLFDDACNRDHMQHVITFHKLKHNSNSNKSKKSSSSKDDSNNESKAQCSDTYVIIKEIVQHHLRNIVTFFTMEPPRKIEGA